MTTRRISEINEKAIYLIAFAITMLSIMIVGGGFWIFGLMS